MDVVHLFKCLFLRVCMTLERLPLSVEVLGIMDSQYSAITVRSYMRVEIGVERLSKMERTLMKSIRKGVNK